MCFLLQWGLQRSSSFQGSIGASFIYFLMSPCRSFLSLYVLSVWLFFVDPLPIPLTTPLCGIQINLQCSTTNRSFSEFSHTQNTNPAGTDPHDRLLC